MLKKFWRCNNNYYFCKNYRNKRKEKHKTITFTLKLKNGKFADSGKCQESVCQF